MSDVFFREKDSGVSARIGISEPVSDTNKLSAHCGQEKRREIEQPSHFTF